MPLELVTEIIDGYASTARRVHAAGLDGVEIVASHGYLPAQFLDPEVNRRTDAYGGDSKRRLRFLREVVGAVRAATNDDFVVGLRISADDGSNDGPSVDDAVTACATLEEDPGLDYVSVCAGTSATLRGSDHIVASMAEPAAYVAPLAAAFKSKLRTPILVAGRINQPQEAENLLTNGIADACAMTRALICDPELPNKAASDRSDDIRACIGCNQACIGHFHAGYPISCIQRPETGRELTYGIRIRARVERDVMVVGAGPAGLKAAAVAAERGHRVRLFDSGRRPGGQVLLAEKLPDRTEFGGAATNLTAEAERAGVTFIGATTVDAAFVRSESPDAVIVATGAGPRRPDLELSDAMPVADAWEVIDGVSLPRGRVVVADWKGDWVGVGVARLLVDAGHKVTLAANGYHAAEALQQYVRDAMLAELARARIEVLPLVRPYGADDDTVYLQHVLTGEPVMVDDVAALVLAQGHESIDALITELADYDGDVVPIGDCLAPRSVEEAVLEGLRAASAL